MGLMVHCGGYECGWDDVLKAETPAPTLSETGRKHVPIPHKTLAVQVKERAEAVGLRVLEEQHALAKDGLHYFGLMKVEPINAVSVHKDLALMLGLRNSHDKKFPAGLCLGTSVFVCDNLAFSSEITAFRRHTTHIMRDLDSRLMSALATFMESRANQDAQITAYKNCGISDMEAYDFVVRAAKEKAIPYTFVERVVKLWDTPPHPEFKERTLWSLFNAFTEANKGIPGKKDSKGRNPFAVVKSTQVLHSLADAFVASAQNRDDDVQDVEYVVNDPLTPLLLGHKS